MYPQRVHITLQRISIVDAPQMSQGSPWSPGLSRGTVRVPMAIENPIPLRGLNPLSIDYGGTRTSVSEPGGLFVPGDDL